MGAPSLKDRYIVVLDDSADSAEVAKEHGNRYGVQDRLVYGSALEGYAGKIPPGQLDKIKSDPRVAYVEPDGIATKLVTQTGATWGLDRIDQRTLPLSGTYTYEQTGAGVTAYVIDTGIRTTHSEFGGRASLGAEFVTDSTTADDCDGHGTHVAGTIGGSTWGVAKGVNLVAVRVLDCGGSGAWSWVISGINWVTQQHDPGEAAVANMSLGGSAIQSVDDAVAASIADGVTYSVSAGNSNRDACGYSPARTAAALTMGSTTSTDARSSFSNWGNCVDWFAPGSSITSANMNGGSLTLSGTSMSAPHTAGAAALYLQGRLTDSPAQVRSALASALTTGVVTGSNSAANHLLYVGSTEVVPPTPVTISLSTRGYKPRPNRRAADLTWSGATTGNVDIYRNNVRITTTANDGFHTDNIGGKGSGSFTYRVCNAGSTTACSNNSTVVF